jgi:parvulin-like peptidyl-prolyl isomerase
MMIPLQRIRRTAFLSTTTKAVIGVVLACAVSLRAEEATKASDSIVVGRVGASEVQVDDVRHFLSGLNNAQTEAVNRDPALLNQLVRSFLVQKIVLKEAMAKKWDQQPGVVAQLERVRESTLTDSYLQSRCNPPAEYPGEEDLKAAYEANRAALWVPRSFRLAQIFVSDPKDAGDKDDSAKAQKKLAELRNTLKSPGADFAALARLQSEERDSASRGGEIGWLVETQIQPEIRDRLPALALNAISEPLRLADGWHFIKVLDIREAHTPTLEQVRVRLTAEMRAEKLRMNTQEYLAKVLQQNPIAINELLLSKVLEGPKP